LPQQQRRSSISSALASIACTISFLACRWPRFHTGLQHGSGIALYCTLTTGGLFRGRPTRGLGSRLSRIRSSFSHVSACPMAATRSRASSSIRSICSCFHRSRFAATTRVRRSISRIAQLGTRAPEHQRAIWRGDRPNTAGARRRQAGPNSSCRTSANGGEMVLPDAAILHVGRIVYHRLCLHGGRNLQGQSGKISHGVSVAACSKPSLGPPSQLRQVYYFPRVPTIE
jgi:hypothetical protein